MNRQEKIFGLVAHFTPSTRSGTIRGELYIDERDLARADWHQLPEQLDAELVIRHPRGISICRSMKDLTDFQWPWVNPNGAELKRVAEMYGQLLDLRSRLTRVPNAQNELRLLFRRNRERSGEFCAEHVEGNYRRIFVPDRSQQTRVFRTDVEYACVIQRQLVHQPPSFGRQQGFMLISVQVGEALFDPNDEMKRLLAAIDAGNP